MTNQTTVRLRWLVPLPEGGMSPRGERFSLPAKFDHQGDDWTKNAWSLVVESKGPSDARGVQEVRVHFLASNGPTEWLAQGRRFTLHEGAKPIAEGEIM